ncbi:Putative E3 ubiquitin-protein ligase [Savitreella phatthalungensis]
MDFFRRRRAKNDDASDRPALDLKHAKAQSKLLSRGVEALTDRSVRTGKRSLSDICVCCGSTVTFASGNACFRCAVCTTVNDIRGPDLEIPADGLTAEEVASLTSKASDDADQRREAIIKRIAIVFSSARTLNASFNKRRWPTLTDHGLDLPCARIAFLQLSEDPQLMSYCTQTISAMLDRPGKRIRQAPDARYLMLLLEMPNLAARTDRRTDRQHSGQHVLKRILGILSNLSNDTHQYLVNWFVRYPQDIFADRVAVIQAFLSHRLAKLGRSETRTYVNDWQIKAAARVLALFHSANSIRRNPLPLTSFYVTLTDYIDLGKDFSSWKAKSTGFSFCSYPFLITLKQKQRILALDALRQQRLQLREAYFAALDSGRDQTAMLALRIRRSHLMEDSIKAIAAREDDLKKRLVVEFVGEEGVDAGGLKKEFFLLLCRQLFDPRHGLFERDEDSNFCWFSNLHWDRNMHASRYHLLGIILGLAIYNDTILDVQLPPALFKKLIGQPCALHDLKLLHPSLGQGLQKLLDFDGDVESTFCRNFVVERRDKQGHVHTVPLCPDGENLPVTNDNRRDFVNRFVAFTFDESCQRPMFHLSRGFHQVAGGNALSLLRAEEIELLVRGSPDKLDLDDLQAVCIYEGFAKSTSEPLAEPTIQWFWAFFADLPATQQRKLLSFITGSDRIPATGTVDMQFRITLDSEASANRLPIAHTCFSQLIMPSRYPTAAVLEHKLLQAMHESYGFSLS